MISFVAGGGGDEIGASFYVLKLGEKYAAIDCGIRPNDMDNIEGNIEYCLPNFNICPKLDFLFITHSHLDHLGGAPCLIKKYEDLKIFMTPETRSIGEIQWNEAIKIANREEKPSLFNEFELNIFLSKIQNLPLNEEINFGDFSVKAISAGHILGAVSLFFFCEGKKIFVTGDISFTDQEIIEGVKVNSLPQVDYLISESTYFNHPRPTRTGEKARFLSDVKKILKNNGQILIPAFSIGRAQEMYEMLRRSYIFGTVPIYIDGMAKSISDLYKNTLPEKIDPEIANHYVIDKVQRNEILREKCIVIASSGMLIGGASLFYAKKWMRWQNNAILFTGFLQPGCTGWTVLNSPEESIITLKNLMGENRFYTKRCKVVQYNFSAHASDEELAKLRQTLNPKLTILVHGENVLTNEIGTIVPRNDQTIELN